MKDRVFQKHPQTILELKTAIQSHIEAIIIKNLTRVPNNFVLRLYKFRDPKGHHMKYILV
jgi:hypothetical protein